MSELDKLLGVYDLFRVSELDRLLGVYDIFRVSELDKLLGVYDPEYWRPAGANLRYVDYIICKDITLELFFFLVKCIKKR